MIAHRHPDHRHLRRIGEELHQRHLLVAVIRRRVREAAGELVLPSLLRPKPERRIQEQFERPRHHAEIGDAAENDAVGSIQLFKRIGVMPMAVLDLRLVDADRMHGHAVHGARAFDNGLRLAVRRLARRMIDHGNGRHVGSPHVMYPEVHNGSSRCRKPLAENFLRQN